MKAPRGASLLLATAALLGQTLGQVITVTEYASACSAIYTSGTTSVTVVQSTVTVVPTPFNDAAANSGTPFVLQINAPRSSKRKRGAQYIGVDGYSTDVKDSFAHYSITNGQLYITGQGRAGGYMSTSASASSQPFAEAAASGGLNTTFVVQNGALNWTNSAFFGGFAVFYEDGGQRIIINFKSTTQTGWSLISLVAVPVSVITASSSEPTYSMTSYIYNPSATSSLGSTASPTRNPYLSPDGTCGTSSGWECRGSGFGDCCSPYGYCGSSDAFCGAGCQFGYGVCFGSPSQGPPSATSSAASSPVVVASSSSSPATVPSNQSPDGTCGGNQGYHCAGSGFGECCSNFGYCGSGSGYCEGSNCQPPFGLCSGQPIPSSTPPVSSGMSSMVPGSSTMPSLTPVTTGSIPVSAASVTMHSSTSPMSSSSPLSTYTSAGQPIGPNNPASTAPSSTTVTPVSVASSSGGSMSSSPSVSLTSGSLPAPISSLPSLTIASSTLSSSAPTSTPTQPISPMGHCGTSGNGGTSDGYTCTGSQFGDCCSNSGFCGSTADYCVAGCQAGFGTCTRTTGNPITSMGECGPNQGNQTCTGGIFGPCCSGSGFCGTGDAYCSSNAACDPNFGTCDPSSSTTSMPASSSPAAGTSSSSGPAPTSTPAYVCPTVDGQTVTDQYGTSYVIGCGADTSSGSYSQQPAANSWNDCFAACASVANIPDGENCTAFTYLGGTNGIGGGNCYLKSSNQEDFTPGSLNLVGAIVLQDYVDAPEPSSSIPASSSAPPTSSPVISSASSALSSASSVVSSASSVVSSILQQATTTTTTTTSSSHPPTTTTTTTAASSPPASSTVRSSSSASSYLVLSSPTPCSFGDPPGTDEDDSYCEIDLPFSMRMYGALDTHSFASTNGLLSIQYGSSQYQADTLPDPNIPNNTVCPFFDDLYLYGNSNPQQGIFYQFNSANTAITYEYYLARIGTSGQIFHFTVNYDSTQPGIFTITYYATGTMDNGQYASVGIQGYPATGPQQGYGYSFQSASITPGLSIVCNTLSNTCSTLSS